LKKEITITPGQVSKLGLDPITGHVSVWAPGSSQVVVRTPQSSYTLKESSKGLFEAVLPKSCREPGYQIQKDAGKWHVDPYHLPFFFSPKDQEHFTKGVHGRLYHVMGSQKKEVNGSPGILFTLWAPNASSVFVTGEFNNWCKRSHPLRRVRNSSVWELFIPFLKEGSKYQFYLYDKQGKSYLKADPFAKATEKRPGKASIVAEHPLFNWSDQQWLKQRVENSDFENQPIHIYEVHLGSWQKENGEFINYKKLAHLLAEHCQASGFNFVELLPVMGHPLDESWGYQVTSFFSVTPRHGSALDFQYFVNYLHTHGIGVILDWVPGHFPKDEHGLSNFDGAPLFEDAHPLRGENPQWTTAVFDYNKPEVRNFLISSALLFIERFHLDGLRVDAVSSMVFLDFCKQPDQWEPNKHGGNHHLEGIAFLKQLCSSIKAKDNSVMLIAEESHHFPGVTQKVEEGGLGFDMKWAMGWMHDTLTFMRMDAELKAKNTGLILFELFYFFKEKYLLALSHDEVVHGKGSLLTKMPGNEWEKFAHLRLLISYMVSHPGKKLLFMGSEIAQFAEWDVKGQIHWELSQLFYHRCFFHFFENVSALYKKTPDFYTGDFQQENTQVIDGFENHALVLVLKRGKESFCIYNFSKKSISRACFKIDKIKAALVFFNSDCIEFGGKGEAVKASVEDGSLILNLPPLSALFVRVEYGNDRD
jgi:1,4-alpha-glucan branching enzyme